MARTMSGCLESTRTSSFHHASRTGNAGLECGACATAIEHWSREARIRTTNTRGSLWTTVHASSGMVKFLPASEA
eukprot:14996371-Heterocapsa_arctica.AAC.1